MRSAADEAAIERRKSSGSHWLAGRPTARAAAFSMVAVHSSLLPSLGGGQQLTHSDSVTIDVLVALSQVDASEPAFAGGSAAAMEMPFFPSPPPLARLADFHLRRSRLLFSWLVGAAASLGPALAHLKSRRSDVLCAVPRADGATV